MDIIQLTKDYLEEIRELDEDATIHVDIKSTKISLKDCIPVDVKIELEGEYVIGDGFVILFFS